MAKKEPLYPHKTKAESTKDIRVRRTARAVDGGTVKGIQEYDLDAIEPTLRSYFNIGAKKITIEYDTLIVEWTLITEE